MSRSGIGKIVGTAPISFAVIPVSLVSAVLFLSSCSGQGNDNTSTSAVREVNSEPSPEQRETVGESPQGREVEEEQETNVSLQVRVEFWDQADATAIDDGGCTLTSSSGWSDEISRGESITLVGPDDVELATAGFSRGRYKKTIETNTEYWEKIPKKKVCTFEADFGQVPSAATYRLKYRGYGISDLAFSPEIIDSYNGTMVVIFGGKVRD